MLATWHPRGADNKGKIDAIINVPPYATALPYLDTDRLSLCYLGLLSRPEHRQRDQDMIGNREISEGQRQRTGSLSEQEEKLPKSVSNFGPEGQHPEFSN